MRESALAVAVAQCPDTRRTGAQLIVDRDVPVRVYRDAGRFQPEIVGIRTPANRQQHMRAANLRRAGRAFRVRHNLFAALGKADALRVHADADLLARQDLLNGRGHIFVFPLHQPRPHFQDGDPASKTPEHLAELQADIAAAHNDQVSGEEVDVHHGTVSEIRDLIQSGHLRHYRAPAHVDEDPLGGEPVRSNADLLGRLEAGVALIDGAVVHVLQPSLQCGPRLTRNGVLPGFHPPHVDAPGSAGIHSELGCAPNHMGGVGACHHGLGRNAARVDAGATEQFALDYGDFRPTLGQTRRQ